jgi:hypothetical protein
VNETVEQRYPFSLEWRITSIVAKLETVGNDYGICLHRNSKPSHKPVIFQVQEQLVDRHSRTIVNGVSTSDFPFIK